LVVASVVLDAQDWPQWRGPARDGLITGFKEPSKWPGTLTQRWKVEVGSGYATPLIAGDRIYVFSRQGEDEVMMALEAPTGKPVWKTSYPAPFKMNPATAKHGPGPKSTPTLADNRLFTLGMSGMVTAFDARTGARLWQTATPPVEPLYHTAMSPVVAGDLVIIHVGGHDKGALTAFDTATGTVRWKWEGDGPAYGSPLIMDLAGTRQVVTFTQKNLVGVSLAHGALLWQRPFAVASDTSCQTPILYKDMVIETGRGNGVTAFKVVKRGDGFATENVWHTAEVSAHMSDAVVIDGLLFGLSHLNSGRYFALDLENGHVLWQSEPRQAEHAAIARAGQTIFSLEDDAELVVLRNSRDKFDPVVRYEVASSATWSQPVVSQNRILIRDVSTIALWTIN